VDDVVELPSGGDGEDPDSRVPLDVVRVLLDSIYKSAVSTAIRLSNEHGAFPPAQWPLHWFPIPPLVADANVLRNDILYACRHDQRTSLVTAATAPLYQCLRESGATVVDCVQDLIPLRHLITRCHKVQQSHFERKEQCDECKRRYSRYWFCIIK